MSIHINRYIANGITTVFPYTFVLLSEGDIAVTVGGQLLTKGSDYTISGIGSDTGGNVTIASAPADGLEIIFARYITLERLIRYQSNGDMTATTLNSDFDRLWMAIQDTDSDSARMLKLPMGTQIDQLINFDATARAGRAVIFDAAGNVTISAGNYEEQAAKANEAANSALIAGQHKDAAAASATGAAASASQAEASKAAAQNAAQTAASSAATQTAAQITQAMQGYVTSATSSATQSANSATQSAEARDAAVAAAASVSPVDLLHKSGAETITGQKTFITPPIGAHTPGQMVATFADTPPPRTLVCNGGVVSRALYSALFAVIGTKYGAGDGSTTFGLPNFLQDLAIVAAGSLTVGSISSGSVIGHSHSAWTDAQGEHQHSYLDKWGELLGMLNGAAATSRETLQTDHWRETKLAGSHKHNVGVGTTGGTYNLAGGVRLLICIAY